MNAPFPKSNQVSYAITAEGTTVPVTRPEAKALLLAPLDEVRAEHEVLLDGQQRVAKAITVFGSIDNLFEHTARAMGTQLVAQRLELAGGITPRPGQGRTGVLARIHIPRWAQRVGQAVMEAGSMTHAEWGALLSNPRLPEGVANREQIIRDQMSELTRNPGSQIALAGFALARAFTREQREAAYEQIDKADALVVPLAQLVADVDAIHARFDKLLDLSEDVERALQEQSRFELLSEVLTTRETALHPEVAIGAEVSADLSTPRTASRSADGPGFGD